MTHRKRFMGFCASCARRLRKGDYLLCSKGCGARLCRHPHPCIPQHNPNCSLRPQAYTDNPQET